MFVCPTETRSPTRQRWPDTSPILVVSPFAADGSPLTDGIAVASAGVVALATIGGTVFPLRRISLLAPRQPDIGAQGIPINRTAFAAAVKNAEPDVYRLRITGKGRTAKEFAWIDVANRPRLRHRP